MRDCIKLQRIYAFSFCAFMVLTFTAPAARSQETFDSAAQRFANPDTSEVPDFQQHVVPLLGRLGCNAAKCHGSFQGEGGFRLSLFGFDFGSDHAALTGEAHSVDGWRADHTTPDSSLILLKPTEQIDHDGGRLFDVNSWEYNLLARWVESGAVGVSGNASLTPDAEEPNEYSFDQISHFENKVLPILEDNCFECHGFNNRKGGLQLNSLDSLLTGGDTGSAVVPGEPDSSLIITAVRYTNDSLQMPPSGSLSEQEIRDLEEWVGIGAPWPDSLSTYSTQQVRQLANLRYSPEEILFSEDSELSQLTITAEWADGVVEDVTCLTRFQSNDPSVADVDIDGLVTSLGPGDTHIIAMYDNGVVAVPILRRFQHDADTHAIADEFDRQNPVDQHVLSKLNKLGISPSTSCSDAEFIRRLSIDLTGTLPTPEEVVEFLNDDAPDKRIRKIDELLERPTYAAWWSNKLCDFTGCNPASLQSVLEVATEEGHQLASQWYDWTFTQVERNVPYDELVEGIMLANVQTRSIDANADEMPHYWRRQSLKLPQDYAMSVAHSFLGIQMQCAECHKHPFDQWTQNDFNDFAQFFSAFAQRRRRPSVTEETELTLLRDQEVTLQVGDDPRQPIMDWMQDPSNPWFARAFVNRVWASYFHVGIVDPPDQFTPANPPSNPELLSWLTSQFIENDYDMKWLHRQITSSNTYQRSWIPNETNREDRRNFSRAIPRRIPAEVLYDALKQTTASADEMDEVRTNLVRRASGHLSMRMSGTHAMSVFGKPDRAINCDCERVNEPTLLQAIFMQNDPLVRMRINASAWIIEIEEIVDAGGTVDRREIIDQVWLRTVCRYPNDIERGRANEHIESSESLPDGVRDLMWAMLNTKEFLLNH